MFLETPRWMSVVAPEMVPAKFDENEGLTEVPVGHTVGDLAAITAPQAP